MGKSPRIGLVLGGGGVRGASWLTGALHGLATETGRDPAAADLLVGTSAGAVVAALTMAGALPEGFVSTEPIVRQLPAWAEAVSSTAASRALPAR